MLWLCPPSARPLCWVSPCTLGPHHNFWISMCISPPLSGTRYMGFKNLPLYSCDRHMRPYTNTNPASAPAVFLIHWFLWATFSNYIYKVNEVRNFEYTTNKRTNNITNWLTPLSRILSEYFVVSQLVKKFPEVLEIEGSLQHSQVPATCTPNHEK